MSFERAVDFVLEQEGGGTITEDPNDPGGLTKWGISQAAYPDLNIRKLTEADAIAIYKRDYWERCRCDELPPALAIVVFDMAVNQGPVTAIRMLQTSLNVKVDGVIGPITLKAAETKGAAGLTEMIARRFYSYGRLALFSRYGLGWSRRVSACHALALSL